MMICRSYLTVPTLVSVETDLKFTTDISMSYSPVVITETVTTFSMLNLVHITSIPLRIQYPVDVQVC